MLDQVREALPGSLAQAEEVLGGRQQVVAEAQQEAQRIIESAQAERGSMVSGTEVVRSAQEEADRILAQARQEAAEVRAEADDYVDSKLANFEVVLSKTIGSVDRGREKLLGSGPGSEEWSEHYAAEAPERSTDPGELRQRADEYVDARLGSVSAVLSKTLEAVGRGRQKLLGQSPSEELGDHMAAQDGMGDHPGHTNDADYLAGLAELSGAAAAPEPSQTPAPPPVPPQQAPMGGVPQQAAHPAELAGAAPYPAGPETFPQQAVSQPAQPPQPVQPLQQPVAYGQADAYGYQESPYPPQDHQGYGAPGYGQDYQAAWGGQEYGDYGGDGTASWQQPYPPQQPDPYAAPPQPPVYDPGQYGAGQYDPGQYGAPGQTPYDPPQYQPQPQLDETSLFDTSMIDVDQVRRFENRER